MKIRTKLRAGTIATALLILLFIGMLLFFVSAVRQANERQQFVEEVRERSFQLSLLRAEYLQHPGERVKIQWISQYEAQVRSLEENASLFSTEFEKEAIEKIRASIERSRSLFAELVRTFERAGSDTIIQELSNQMAAEAQTRASFVLRLSDVSRQAVATAARRLTYAVFIIGMLVFGISIGTYFVNRKIAQSIEVLGEGTKVIASGDLTYQLPITGQDEISDVAKLFNKMASELSASYTTLEQKIEERTKEVSTMLNALDQVALVSMTDAKGDITYANDRFVEVSKYTREELIGQNHRILKSGHQRQLFFTGLWTTISGGKIWRGEIKNRAKDGTYYWVDTSIAPVLNKAGKPERYISVRFLVTEHKRAMQDIKKFQQAVLSSTEAVLIISNPDRTITFINPAWSRLTGFSSDEVLGRRLEYSRAEKTDPKVLDAFREAMRTGQPFYSDEFVLKRKDGTEYSAEFRMYPVRKEEEEEVNEPEHVAFFVVIHADITDRKQSERAKTQFVSLASHQLRTPLTEIRWALSSLGREQLTKEQKEVVETAHSASSHMAETIKAMLTISHIETGEMNPEPAPMNVRAAIDDVARLYDNERQQKHLSLTIQCPKSIDLITDEQLFKEVIGNLLINAYKYTPQNGKIDATVTIKQDRIIITVADTGCGIPLRDQKHIARKFFRASNAADIGQEGSGLGLHIAYSLIKLLGGTISFTSQENIGTTFTLTFPYSL